MKMSTFTPGIFNTNQPSNTSTPYASTTAPSTIKPTVNVPTFNAATNIPISLTSTTTMPPKGVAGLVKQNISDPAKNYNDTHLYQSFEMDVMTGKNVLGNQDNAFGVITSQFEMILFDDNLYDQNTAQYAIETFYTQKLWEQHNYFNANKSSYVINAGLKYQIFDRTMISPDATQQQWDVNYFSKQIRDNINSLANGTTNDMSSLMSSISGFDFASINTNFYVEWFGYICPNKNGLYNFQFTSPDIVHMWIGNTALTDFTLDNETSSTQKIPMTAGAYYPIRIQYGMGVTSVKSNMKLNISVFFNGDFLSNGAGLFFNIFDKTNTPYEPIQLHYALTQYTSGAIASNLYNLYYTLLNTVNNYDMNQQLRIAKINKNKMINMVTLIQCTTTDMPCIFSIQPDGNGVLSNSTSSVQLTHFDSSTKNLNYSKCKGGTNFQSVPTVSLNGISLNKYYTVSREDRVDTSSGLPYVNYSFNSFKFNGNTNDPLTNIIQNNYNSQYTLQVNYTLGSEQITENHLVTLVEPLNISNLSKVVDCLFTFEIKNGGDISLRNYNQGIWNFFNDTMNTNAINQVKQVLPNTISNPDWLFEYKTALNNGVNLSHMFSGEQLDVSNSLYTPDGMCKLSVQGNQLVYSMVTMPTKGKIYTDNNDPQNTFYLFSALGDMKFNTNMLVDTTNNTMQYVPVGGNILKYRSNFKDAISNQYSFPPFTNGTTLPDGYQLFENTSNADCKKACLINPQCSHYYSYKMDDNSFHCVVNNNGNIPKYLPKTADSTVSQSNLYVRQKYINSDCKINTYQPVYSNNLVTTDQYNSFQSYSFANEIYDPSANMEGPCGIGAIAQNLSMFQSGVNTVGRNTVEGFDNSKSSQIPGFNPNICNDLNKSACISDINKNVTALNKYHADNVLATNQKVYDKYSSMQTQIYQDFIKKYNDVNINPQYDAINNAGELIDANYNKSLLSGMIYDIKNQMMGENTKYILINLLSATVFVAILALAP